LCKATTPGIRIRGSKVIAAKLNPQRLQYESQNYVDEVERAGDLLASTAKKSLTTSFVAYTLQHPRNALETFLDLVFRTAAKI